MPAPLSENARAFAGRRIDIVGRGRVGTALAARLGATGVDVHGPFGRGATGERAEIVLLAVPDAAIGAAAALIAPGRLVGHLSGASPLDLLAPHEGFGIHPLLTVTDGAASFAGASAAVAGSTPRALETARTLAQLLDLRPFAVADADRAAYHAAASIAANFLVTLEGFASDLAATADVDRTALAPLVRAAVDAWEARGAAGALTGPIGRGDEATVARQRAAVAERMPGRLPLFDALAAATRDLAGQVPLGEPAESAVPAVPAESAESAVAAVSAEEAP